MKFCRCNNLDESRLDGIMLSEINQIKQMLWKLKTEWTKIKQKLTQTQSTGGWEAECVRISETGERDEEVPTSNYKIVMGMKWKA